MPIILNNSNIEIQYNTGSSYIIENVKSDILNRDIIGTTSNLFAEPTVSPTITSNLAVFTHSGGAENQTPHTIYFPVNTTCDILIVGGGGGGGKAHGGGGGAGSLIYLTNVSLNAGTYTVNVGKGGAGATARDGAAGGGPNNGSDSSIFYNGTNIYLAKGGGGGKSAIGPGASGGSGGGGNGTVAGGVATGGAALTTNIPSGSYGNSGGSGRYEDSGNLNDWSGGGGGGANGVGGSAAVNAGILRAGNGGDGSLINITGTGTYYAAGGGGGCIVGNKNNNTVAGSGGLGGGGNGGSGGSVVNGTNASNNTGSGGGGGGRQHNTDIDGNGGAGGSGIIIIKVISPTTNKYLFFNYLPAQPTLNYTLTFPTRTIVNFINSVDEVMNGQYTVSVRTTQSTITPTQGQLLKNKIYSTSNLSARYHLLNPIRTDEGAQWTYSSNNPNVYHLGSVGIGTTSPEYLLDVRGFIYSSSGGYTSSALTKWSVLSDRRIKENIVKASYEKCLENVKNIELYNFNFKDNYVNTNDRHQLGFIAQEVQQVYPKAVEFSRMIMNLEEKIDDLLTLNTTQIDYTLYGAVKCLIKKLENIKIKMEQIKTVYNIKT